MYRSPAVFAGKRRQFAEYRVRLCGENGPGYWQGCRAGGCRGFQDAVLETLAHAERFNPEMQARPWFLAIAANILKRHRNDFLKRYRFEVLTSDLMRQIAWESEGNVLDQMMGMGSNSDDPEQVLVTNEGLRELLALVTPKDAQLLHMALIQGWDAKALAELMGVTPGTVRVRVHRALNRLRVAWRQSQQRKERGGYYG